MGILTSKWFDLILLLLVASASLLLVTDVYWIKLAILPIPIVTVFWFWIRHNQLLGVAFLLMLCSCLRLLSFVSLGLFFIIPLIVYIVLSRFIPRLNLAQPWMLRGSFNRKVWILTAITVLISSLALLAWYQLVKPDISAYLKIIPPLEWYWLILLGLGFSLLNSIVEEFILRGLLWSALESLIQTTWVVVGIQAIIFGMMHLAGFPSGISGVVLATIYGVMLGLIRHFSRGLFAPVLAHIFADITIYCIIFLIAG